MMGFFNQKSGLLWNEASYDSKVKEYGGLYSYKPIYIFKSKYCDFSLVFGGNPVTTIQYTIQDIVSEWGCCLLQELNIWNIVLSW